MTLPSRAFEGYGLYCMLGECCLFLCSILLSHSTLFSNGGSNEGDIGETIALLHLNLGSKDFKGEGD